MECHPSMTNGRWNEQILPWSTNSVEDNMVKCMLECGRNITLQLQWKHSRYDCSLESIGSVIEMHLKCTLLGLEYLSVCWCPECQRFVATKDKLCELGLFSTGSFLKIVLSLKWFIKGLFEVTVVQKNSDLQPVLSLITTYLRSHGCDSGAWQSTCICDYSVLASRDHHLQPSQPIPTSKISGGSKICLTVVVTCLTTRVNTS